ncbi:hypothetical protein [Marinigracilibium pacificum]|uniref:Uncharacterized protein n=1 Tax=Marinigracilibium pacificum TaxID=2729599 RepID=A0A848J3H0_9BACT|nr:hypothetical protein [Marinigracilibium pacificum]NMM48899.1 hypothetical protein [Marinigracilibium pacificum]
MKNLFLLIGLTLITVQSYACDKCKNYNNDNFQIKCVSVKHSDDIAATIWEITVSGTAGATTPQPAGQLNGAPVLGYVFPTTLKPTDVGFSDTEGIVALALTSHPDFDDTPLWDENSDRNYANDGIIWHPHWVVLTKDDRVKGELAVKQFTPKDPNVTLPPTNPGMPMYMDSPGFQVITKANTIKVVVPDYRINNKTEFSFDGVTAFMQVNTSKEVDKPMLGVYQVFSVASGDLSLPYKVK